MDRGFVDFFFAWLGLGEMMICSDDDVDVYKRS